MQYAAVLKYMKLQSMMVEIDCCLFVRSLAESCVVIHPDYNQFQNDHLT